METSSDLLSVTKLGKWIYHWNGCMINDAVKAQCLSKFKESLLFSLEECFVTPFNNGQTKEGTLALNIALFNTYSISMASRPFPNTPNP
jgi:hypothetical protein